MFSNRVLHRVIKSSFVLYIFWVFLFGISQTSMDMDAMNSKANCPFGGHPMVICQMNPTEHIQEWQSAFATLPVQGVAAALLALLAFFAVVGFKLWTKIPFPNLRVLCSRSRRTRTVSFKIRDPLKEAFSSGILNPKIY